MEKHFATSGFVMNRDRTKMLMIHHKKLNIWAVPGGHLEPNELPEDGAKREIKEETGIDAVVLDCSDMQIPGSRKEHQLISPYLTLYETIPKKGDAPEHVHVDFIFLCEADEDKVNKQEREVNDAKWMTWKEILEADTFESIKTFARSMLGGDSCARIQNCFNPVL